MSIKVTSLSKKYGSQLALDDISFEIRKGQIVGFIGPNGAGKSTAMKIITGYIPPTSGDVHINGMDVVEHSLEIRKLIGYLPENNPLYPDMYVREYLKYVAGIYRLGKQSREKVEYIIEVTGLTRESKKKIGALSKGYRQRVGLAQALIHDPEILILDEPTSGLDPNQIVEIRTLISLLGKEKTVMLSTHIMQEVEAICDRVIIIDKGKIVADEKAGKITGAAAQSSPTIIVEFDLPVEKEKLTTIEGTGDIKTAGGNTWLIQSAGEQDIRPLIFEFAVANSLKVLSLQKQEKRLEDVFRELTGG